MCYDQSSYLILNHQAASVYDTDNKLLLILRHRYTVHNCNNNTQNVYNNSTKIITTCVQSFKFKHFVVPEKWYG